MLRTRVSRYRLAIASLLVGPALISGCTAAASKTADNTSSSAVANGGTLVIAQNTDAQPNSFLSPALGNILTEYAVFETLTLSDVKTGKPRPVLAQSWTLAPDGKGMVINLRHDVTFHDGRKMTSADVVYTLKQMQDPAVDPQGVPLASQISAIKAQGDYQVALRFSRSLPNIFDLFDIMPIVEPTTFGQIASGKKVIGTGPFEWSSWTPGSEIVLQKYPKYRDAKDIHLDKIEIDVITDPTALLAAIKSGRVQSVSGLTPLDARTLGNEAGYKLFYDNSGGSSLPLAFDVRKAPFNNPTVRQAVQYAIDRKRVLAQVEGGLGHAVDLPWKTTDPGFDQSQFNRYPYDPSKAKTLLAQAGVKAGTSFTLVTPNYPESVSVVQIIKNDLAAVGLDAKVQVITGTDYDDRISKGDMGAAAFLMRNGGAFSPATKLEVRPELRATNNVEHFSSPAYTKAVQDVTDAVSPQQQSDSMKALNDYFLDQAFCVSVVVRPSLWVRKTKVDGIGLTAYGFADLTRAYLTK